MLSSEPLTIKGRLGWKTANDVVGVSPHRLDTAFAEVVLDFDHSVIAARDKVRLVCTWMRVYVVYAAFLVCLQSEFGC